MRFLLALILGFETFFLSFFLSFFSVSLSLVCSRSESLCRAHALTHFSNIFPSEISSRSFSLLPSFPFLSLPLSPFSLSLRTFPCRVIGCRSSGLVVSYALGRIMLLLLFSLFSLSLSYCYCKTGQGDYCSGKEDDAAFCPSKAFFQGDPESAALSRDAAAAVTTTAPPGPRRPCREPERRAPERRGSAKRRPRRPASWPRLRASWPSAAPSPASTPLAVACTERPSATSRRFAARRTF